MRTVVFEVTLSPNDPQRHAARYSDLGWLRAKPLQSTVVCQMNVERSE